MLEITIPTPWGWGQWKEYQLQSFLYSIFDFHLMYHFTLWMGANGKCSVAHIGNDQWNADWWKNKTPTHRTPSHLWDFNVKHCNVWDFNNVKHCNVWSLNELIGIVLQKYKIFSPARVHTSTSLKFNIREHMEWIIASIILSIFNFTTFLLHFHDLLMGANMEFVLAHRKWFIWQIQGRLVKMQNVNTQNTKNGNPKKQVLV